MSFLHFFTSNDQGAIVAIAPWSISLSGLLASFFIANLFRFLAA